MVQFTALASAIYTVTGEHTAMGKYSGVTDDSVGFTSGLGSTLLYSTTSASNPFNTFSFSQAMTAGQSLDFAVGLGPGGQFYYDSTGFDATITATPEPGLYGVLALGFTGLVAAVRGRKNA